MLGGELSAKAKARAKERDLEVTTFDYIPASVAFATKIIDREELKAECCPQMVMPFERHTYDVIVCTFCMCSINDVRGYLSEVQRVLKPGGMYIFIEHVPDPLARGYRSLFYRLYKLLHYAVFAGCDIDKPSHDYITEFFSVTFSKEETFEAGLNRALMGKLAYGAAVKKTVEEGTIPRKMSSH